MLDKELCLFTIYKYCVSVVTLLINLKKEKVKFLQNIYFGGVFKRLLGLHVYFLCLSVQWNKTANIDKFTKHR